MTRSESAQLLLALRAKLAAWRESHRRNLAMQGRIDDCLESITFDVKWYFTPEQAAKRDRAAAEDRYVAVRFVKQFMDYQIEDVWRLTEPDAELFFQSGHAVPYVPVERARRVRLSARNRRRVRTALRVHR